MTAQPQANPCTSSFVRPSRASSVTHGIGWVRHSCRGVLPCGIVLLSRSTRHTALTATASRAMPGVPLCRSRSDGLRPHSLIARRGACGVISSGRIMMSSFSSLPSLRCASDARPRPPVPCRAPTAKGRDRLHAMSGSHPVKPNGASGRLAVCVRLPVASPASHAGASHGHNDKERGCPSRAAPQSNSIKSEKSFAYFLNLTTLPSATAM